ncbi:MAG: Mammalian cell entry related domain protein [Proteobacteria bacterium]|nr:Mammalian cell entry related domain protein [Pseudomonadota bacterium]
MENKAHALAAGIFTLLVGLAVLGAIYWFGGKKEKTAQYLVETTQNVTGLSVQAQVRYRGIRVGKVVDIDLDDENAQKILIRIEIDQDVPITKGTVAKLGQQGVTGIAHILLEETGHDMKPLKPVDGKLPRIAMVPSMLEEIGESGTVALKQAKVFFTNANTLFNEKNRQHLAATLSNLESSTAQLNKVLADQRLQRLGSAVAKVDDAADNAKVFFKDAKVLGPRVQALSEKLEVMVGDGSGEGATAAVARVNDLAQELRVTVRQLNRVLQVVERSPDSLLFGAPPRQPGPGEPGFVAPAAEGMR